MNGKETDHILIKMKDVILLIMAFGAITTWVLGITSVPPRVEANESDIKEIKTYVSSNEVFVQGLKKDVSYLKEQSTKQDAKLDSIIQKLDRDRYGSRNSL